MDKVHLQEYACVGAGIGGGFQNTKELRVNTLDRVESREVWLRKNITI